MSRLILAMLGAVSVGVGVAACGSGGGPAPAASVPATAAKPMPTPAALPAGPNTTRLHARLVRVAIVNFAFRPARLVVSKGTRLVWKNADSDPHTVTSDVSGGPLASAALDTNGQYTVALNRTGTFTYHCAIHPQMHGVVVVTS